MIKMILTLECKTGSMKFWGHGFQEAFKIDLFEMNAHRLAADTSRGEPLEVEKHKC